MAALFQCRDHAGGGRYRLDSFVSASQLIELGETATLQALPSIIKWLPGSASAMPLGSRNLGCRAAVLQSAADGEM